MNLLYITPTDHKLLKSKVARLEKKAQELLIKLAEAASHGGSAMHGIPEYRSLEFELKLVDSRIGNISQIIEQYEVKPLEEISAKKIGTYSLVTAEDGTGTDRLYYVQEIEITGPKIREGVQLVSPDSPVGRALVGKAVGQKATFETPLGTKSLKVMALEIKDSSELTLDL